uniref:M23 family metallopeptidase n=1 Tax=Pararhizobium sp. IMCC3301 TaxID=3067904 RepID=UPI00274289FF|nr:M23 family metallopeptidase [Pararhizobium sp. IMCC3301]
MSKNVDKRKIRPTDQRHAKRIILSFGQKTIVLAVHPWVLTSVLTALLLLAFFNVGAGLYLFKRDDLLARNATQEIELRQAYEAKFQRFQTVMESIRDQSADERLRLASELAGLAERQNRYASKQARVAAVLDNARKMGIRVASVSTPTPVIKPGSASLLADSGLSLGGDESAVGGSEILLDDGLDAMPETFEDFERHSSLVDPFNTIEQFQSDLDAMEELNVVSVQAVATAISDEHEAYRAALSGLPVELKLPSETKDVGGPFLPADFDEEALDAASKRIDTQLKGISRLRELSVSLPISKPLKTLNRSSNFGRRIDPFRKSASFHSGIDYRAPTGTPVMATADGQVLKAGRSGGYGIIVELRHANGLTTRFGHLSKTLVKAGQSVKRGDIIAEVGSTGRSTGPHLHYEVRNQGKVRNPQTFMDAGKQVPHL